MEEADGKLISTLNIKKLRYDQIIYGLDIR